MALTSKQEKFCQSIVSGLNQSDAYRSAYNVSPETTSASVNQQAYELMQDLDISLRIEQLRLPIAERIGMGLEAYLKEMQNLKSMAVSAEETANAIKAHELMGKCLGYYVTKTELTGKDGAPVGIKIEKTIVDPTRSS